MKLYLSKKLLLDTRRYASLHARSRPKIQSTARGLLLILIITSAVLIIRPEQELKGHITYTRGIDNTTKTQLNQFLGSRNSIIDFLFVNQFEEDINQLKFIKFATVARTDLFSFELTLKEFIPHAYWHTGTNRVAVDLHGKILTTFTPKERPVVIEFQEISSRHVLTSPNRDALLTLKLIQEHVLAEDLINKNVTYIFSKSKGLSVELQNGSVILLGDSSNIEEKLLVWNIFKEQINTANPKNPVQLDLRFKNQALISNRATSSLAVQKIVKD